MIPHKNSDNEPYWAGHLFKLKIKRGSRHIGFQRVAVVLIKWDVDVERYVVYSMWASYEDARCGTWRIKEIEHTKFFDIAEKVAQKVANKFFIKRYNSITGTEYLKEVENLGYIPVFPSTMQMYVNASVEFGHDDTFDVICLNNKNLKSYFDIDGEYRAKSYRGIFKVEDKFGDFRTCSEKQFETVLEKVAKS